MSKMKGMIDQVLDEIMVEEGGDTEITVASIRGHWDDVHPGTPVPAPGTVRNNLDQLTTEGRLQKLPDGKSWVFALPTEDGEPEGDTPVATTADPEPEKDTKDAPAYDWVELKPGETPWHQRHVMSIRFAPQAKNPYIIVRIRRSVVKDWGRAAFLVDKNLKAVAIKRSADGYQLRHAKKGGDFLQFRVVGVAVRRLFRDSGITMNTTLTFSGYDAHGDMLVFCTEHTGGAV